MGATVSGAFRASLVLVPTLNGEPIGPVFWRVLSGSQEGADPYKVDDRGWFDVTLPEEDGVYEVYMQTWEDPWVRWRDFGAIRPRGGYEDVAMVKPIAGSNPVRFVVGSP